jgi:hypothetical protein
MNERIVKCQDDLNKIPDDFDGLIIITGNVSISKYWAHVEAWGSAHVVAWGSAYVEAWGSAHVEARESAHVVARGSAHVEARGSAHVEAWGSAHVEAGKWTSVHKHFLHNGTIEGKGVIIQIPKIETAEEWCEYRGIKIVDGVAILYKAVRDDYKSAHGLLYAPGSCPEAPDWDGGAEECGGGLHFCASIPECLSFDDKATRFLACPINILDMRNPEADDSYQNKIKAKRVCGPIIEVDIEGKII